MIFSCQIFKILAFGFAMGTFFLLSSPEDIARDFPLPKSISTQSDDLQIVFVPRVIDGDTIEVQPVDPKTGSLGQQEVVRYIGMDTPETVDPDKPVECYGHEASVRDKALVEGKYVAMTKDVSEYDKYGRLLRFVYLLDASNTMVDLELVKEGYARVLTIPPDVEYADEFNAAAATAQSEKLGFWSACPTFPFQGK